MQDYISGIQQVGIGVKNATECTLYYKELFGMDTLVFDDESEAVLMTQYTGQKVYKRQAVLSLNMQGGGGFEIWQFKNRAPSAPLFQPQYGDLGIYAAKIKCADVKKTYEKCSLQKNITLSSLRTDTKGDDQFFVKDAYNNIFDMVKSTDWFHLNGKCTGGVGGAVIGVSDMDSSLPFYRFLLNTSEVVYDVSVTCAETGQRYRKVLLQKSPSCKGAFGKLLGSIQIELVQCLDKTPRKIFASRYWGDCGFIHLCFDVFDMCGLKKAAEAEGYVFTVDSINSFGMEGAAGRFCYVEDPDGTLIELVETHKVPIYKKWGLYLNLKKRGVEKPLPVWMIKLLSLSKVR
jgi:catechol 2,3-dioxygenase-like lactoylglutathione lyase family enzyme